MSSNSAPTENISRFVDCFLQPCAISLPSYIRDTTDFINRLRRLPPLPPGTLMVTLDVSSLYTNIPHEEGIKTCEEFLNSRDLLVPSTADLCHLVRLILTMNCFLFNENHYLQVHGTAMGTRMAPSYANLFMGKLEREFLLTQDLKPRVWWRFIDDIFAIWTHGEESLKRFIESLNRHHATIKFTATWSAEKVTFLDTTVYLKEDGLIGTNLYVKPTDKHQYHRMDSCHPKHCKASIPFSQALRLRRICSEDRIYQQRTRELKQHFLSRGYHEQHLENEFKRALDTSREACLQLKSNQEKPARIPLVVTYHPILPSFHLTTKRHLSILHASERLRRAFEHPPLIAFRRPRNLRDLLVRATLTTKPHESPGNYPCGVPRCKTCPILRVTDEFSSHTTGKVFKVNFRASCKSSNVIYLITCRRCGLQYVGETGQPLHMRMNGHRYDIAHRRTEESPVAEHFNSGVHEELDMTVMAIELARSRDACLRKIRESRWIRTLGTSSPSGMNLRVDGL